MNASAHSALAHNWVPFETTFAAGAAYSEQAQEAVYLPVASTAATFSTAYDESLQEEVYLGMRVPSRTPSPVRLHWANTPVCPETSESQAKLSQTFITCTDSNMPCGLGMKSHGLGIPHIATEAPRQQEQQKEQQRQQQQQQQQQQQVPVKRTFIHYDSLQEAKDRKTNAVRRRASSAPGILVSHWNKRSEKTLVHQRGLCRPCAYFFFKADGCRRVADCDFCHICPPEEFKRRRKEKRKHMKLLKAQALERVVPNENVDPMFASTPRESD